MLPPVLVNVSIDSLYLRLGFPVSQPSEYLLNVFQDWRKYKTEFDYHVEKNQLYFVDLPELGRFRLLPVGHRPYEFVLSNPEIGDIRIWNPERWAKGQQTGQVYLDFRSRFLVGQGLMPHAVLRFLDLAFDLFFDGDLATSWSKVSRADLAADIAGKKLEWLDLEKFVTRARKFDTFTATPPMLEKLPELQNWLAAYDSGNIPRSVTRGVVTTNGDAGQVEGVQIPTTDSDRETTVEIPTYFVDYLRQAADPDPYISRVVALLDPKTIYIGRFGSLLYGRIYDKLASLAGQDKEYMRDIWKNNGWDGESDVTRIEFSISGDFLKGAHALFNEDGNSVDLRDFYNFLMALPQIWGYLTSNWLRHTEPNANDKERWRWESSEWWKVVENAVQHTDVIYRFHGRTKPDPAQLKAQAMGCILSWCVLQAQRNEAISALDEIRDWMFSTTFYESFQERQSEYGMDEFSDTQLSSMFRMLRMREGLGS